MSLLSTPMHSNTIFNPFMLGGLSYLNSLDRSISNRRDVWVVLLFSCFVEIPILNANSIDPDQMPHSAMSDPGLHCFM